MFHNWLVTTVAGYAVTVSETSLLDVNYLVYEYSELRYFLYESEWNYIVAVTPSKLLEFDCWQAPIFSAAKLNTIAQNIWWWRFTTVQAAIESGSWENVFKLNCVKDTPDTCREQLWPRTIGFGSYSTDISILNVITGNFWDIRWMTTEHLYDKQIVDKWQGQTE